VAGRTLSVVKARYSRGLAAGLRLAKGHVRYAVHRSNEQGQRQYREIWDRSATLDKQTAYERLDQTRAADYVYRLTLSPHPEQQDGGKQLDLKAWTRDMMARLERDSGQRAEWFAVTHEHQDHRHVHVVAVSPGRLDVRHLAAMREAGDRNAAAQQRDRSRGRDQQEPGGGQTIRRSRDLERALESPAPRGSRTAISEAVAWR